jgi:dCMP deaminase
MPKKKEEKYIRPSWDEYFIEISQIVATRATCDRGRSGCVIVKDRQILTTGYVGSPKGLPHCDEAGHFFKKTIHDNGEITNHCVRTIHAEQNAICQAAKLGIPLEGSTLYCKMTPCAVCAKLIINCGINRVVCEKHYRGSEESIEMFKLAGVELLELSNETETYANM